MDNTLSESSKWRTIVLTTEEEVFATLHFLRGHRWISRGQSKCYGNLIPKFQRDEVYQNMSRDRKIMIERAAIELFRSMTRFTTMPDEQIALKTDMGVLMLLQHYGAPTRLLDWSFSPYIAAYFSVCNDKECDGEIWSFDYASYEREGGEQWKAYPEIPLDSPIEVRYAMVLDRKEPDPDFFMLMFYYPGFHRETAQEGILGITGKFGRDQADAIKKLLKDDKKYARYVIKAELKSKIKPTLKRWGIWSGSLFPDTVGAAETIKEVLNDHQIGVYE